MSASLVQTVLLGSRAEHASRLVVVVVAKSAWRDDVTWRSQTQICERAKLAERTVRAAIEDLIALGELQVGIRRALRCGPLPFPDAWIAVDAEMLDAVAEAEAIVNAKANGL